MQNFDYKCRIERGHTDINDRIIAFLKSRVKGELLDVGCNSGYLLEEVGHGTGIDASAEMVERGKHLGLDIYHGWAHELPFEDKVFDTVVLSCILEQIPDWKAAVTEAKRVGKRVIGINPYPGSPWGIIHGFVKSVISPDEMQEMGAIVERFDQDRYYFEITQ